MERINMFRGRRKLYIWGWVFAGLFAILCVFLLYLLVDTSTTVEHKNRVVEWEKSDKELCGELLLFSLKQKKRAEIEKMFTEEFKGKYIIEKESLNEFNIENIIFRFEGERLVEISFY